VRSLLSKLSIRWILPAAVVLPVFAVALILTLLAYRTGQRNADDLVAQNIRQIHERIENHLDHLMDLPPAINRLNLSRLNAGALALDEPGRNPKLTFETLQAFPDVSSIVMGSSSGQVMWIIRYPGETTYEYAIKPKADAPMREFSMAADGQIGAAALREYRFDPTVRPWYRAAIEAGAPTWGSIYVWVRGGKGVTLGIPYVEPYRDSRGAVVGVINCELTLSDISAFLKRLTVGKTGMAFIMERDGNLVATSIGIDCMKDGTSRLPAAEAPDSRIAAAAAQFPREFHAVTPIDSGRVLHADIAGKPTKMVISSFRNRRNLDWVIVTLVPDSDFLADVQAARNRSMIIAAAAVLVAMALGIGVAMWLLRPILAVVAHARRVGGGELDARISRNDNREIAQLSSALNEMAAGLQDRLRLRHALNLAMEVQQSLLPGRTPHVKGLDVAARSKYCDETGGDYYDYLDVEGLGPHSLVIAMGDVMGHGIAAAMLMATARGVLRSQARTQGSLGKLLTHLNEHIVADTRGDRFMTMFLAVVDVSTMSMRWASAGHDQPLIYDPQQGMLPELDAVGGGVPLGVMDTEVYEELTWTGLRPGQVMLIGTDGLWESKNSADEEFGKPRVAEALAALAHLSAAEIEAGIYQRLQQFCGGRTNDDDITYVVVKFIS
jgi:serine phosphatase RsbU (regulator of sigma subunit)